MQIPHSGLRRLRGPFSNKAGTSSRQSKPRQPAGHIDNPTVELDDPPREAEFDRFKPGLLQPVDGPKIRPTAEPRIQRPSVPVRVFDRALLAVELFGALVVAWLVFQYIYTVYFDTGPHRVTPASVGAPTGNTGVLWQPTSTPTRIAEVAPPLTGPPPAAHMPIPTPTIDPQLLLPMRLRIPVMFLDSPVHEVTINMGQWEVAPMDIGHHEGTGDPGQVGNVVLAGHRDINSALFRELDRLKPGDEVFVSNSLREYRYIVKESFVVGPNHTEVMDPTDDKRVTLITCTPVGLDTQRLIVTAILDEPDGEMMDGGR
jgi:LPXTG-site transpeptidase (sortase) family protein